MFRCVVYIRPYQIGVLFPQRNPFAWLVTSPEATQTRSKTLCDIREHSGQDGSHNRTEAIVCVSTSIPGFACLWGRGRSVDMRVAEFLIVDVARDHLLCIAGYNVESPLWRPECMRLTEMEE